MQKKQSYEQPSFIQKFFLCCCWCCLKKNHQVSSQIQQSTLFSSKVVLQQRIKPSEPPGRSDSDDQLSHKKNEPHTNQALLPFRQTKSTKSNEFKVESIQNVNNLSQNNNEIEMSLTKSMKDKERVQNIKKEELYTHQINTFQKNIQEINLIAQKTPEDEDELAFAYANLVNLYILTNNKKYEETAKKALQIYQKRSNLYTEQIITLKNNVALALQKEQRLKDAIQLYSDVLLMEDKFYSISDIRRLSTLNNIFCLNMKQSQFQQGRKIYQQCEPILKSMDKKQQICQLFRQNYEYYTSKSAKLKNEAVKKRQQK